MSYLHGKLWMDGMSDAWQMPNSVSFPFFFSLETLIGSYTTYCTYLGR